MFTLYWRFDIKLSKNTKFELRIICFKKFKFLPPPANLKTSISTQINHILHHTGECVHIFIGVFITIRCLRRNVSFSNNQTSSGTKHYSLTLSLFFNFAKYSFPVSRIRSLYPVFRRNDLYPVFRIYIWLSWFDLHTVLKVWIFVDIFGNVFLNLSQPFSNSIFWNIFLLCLKRNWIFVTNSDFLIPISLHYNDV